MDLARQDYCSTVDGVIKGSVIAADSIADAAKWVERGLKRSVPVMHIGLESAVLMAVGRVGIATFGAAAVVGEAVLETTKSVSQKTVSVTADVVRHKYGDQAGQIIQDGCDTTGNILTTIANVAMLESRVWSKSVAKNAGKVQFRNQYDDDEEEELPEDPLLFLDSTKAEAIAVVRRLHRKTSVVGKDVAIITRV
ncbi:hypothetical protein MHU86_25013 [Fragilaria crotonensis]|nr:hypothetical protein MHU86_25013 [Fragilaria crotonensis]